MANIPSRQLDLSLVDLPRNNLKKLQSSSLSHEGTQCDKVLVEDKQRGNVSFCEDKSESIKDNCNENQRLPKTYQEFLEKQKEALKNKKILADN
nr:unnamed protein product [Callosobruchus analis]